MFDEADEEPTRVFTPPDELWIGRVVEVRPLPLPRIYRAVAIRPIPVAPVAPPDRSWRRLLLAAAALGCLGGLLAGIGLAC